MKLFFEIMFLLAFFGLFVFGMWSMSMSAFIFIKAKKSEVEFFKKNINYNYILNSVWRQFWILVRSGGYRDFKNERLKILVKRLLVISKIGMAFFIISVTCLILKWTIFK